MTMRSVLLCAAAAVCSFAITGCHKGPSFGPTGGGDGLRDLFEQRLANATQLFTVSGSTGGTVVGDQGVRVHFPPSAFRTQAGGAVNGDVQIELIEVLDIGDMIRLNITTVGNDNGTLRLLKSGGAVYVGASQGGQALVLGPQGMSIVVPTPDADPAMGVFTANRAEGEDLVWNEEDSTSIDTTFVELPNGTTAIGYLLQVDSLQWINCDYFPWSATSTTVTAMTPANIPNDSTLVWFVFPDMNAVARSYSASVNTFTFGQVPVGLSAVAVALTRNGGAYSSAFTSFTTTTNGSVGLSFQPTTLQAFEAAVEAL